MDKILKSQLKKKKFINALQHKCWRSVRFLVLQPVKQGVFEKTEKKFHDCTLAALNLQPSDLRYIFQLFSIFSSFFVKLWLLIIKKCMAKGIWHFKKYWFILPNRHTTIHYRSFFLT